MKIHSFTFYDKLFAFLGLFMCYTINVKAQTYCLTYAVTNNSTTLDVTLGMVASGSTFQLGAGNLQFKYKTAALSSPTLISNTLTATGRYNGISLTQPTPPSFNGTGDGLVSFNFNFTGILGTGLLIGMSSSTPVAVIRFQIANSSLSPNLRPYDNETVGTVVYNDDPNFPLLLETTGNCPVYNPIAIPLEWLDFQAKVTTEKELKTVQLDWITASEHNIQYFMVERSHDGKVFEEIGTSVAPNNTSSKSYYRVLDAQPWAGVSFYRIHQIDNDGKETFSKVISVSINNKDKLSIYPNPVSTLLNLNESKDKDTNDYQIFNLLGQQVMNLTTSARFQTLPTLIDVSALPQGTYFLKVGVEQVKFIKE